MESQPKFRRLKTGCLTCRARKVKCDETPGTCIKCKNMSVECKWAEQSGPRPSTTPAPDVQLSKRQPRIPACYNCRYARSKCSQTHPSCTRCSMTGLSCLYPPPKAKPTLTPAAINWMQRRDVENSEDPSPVDRSSVSEQAGESSASPAELPAGNNESLVPSRERSERLIAAYFVHVHVYQGNAFLHRDATLQAVKEGNLSQLVLLAIWAVASRFVDPPEPVAVANRWAEEAGKRLVMAQELSRECIITALLLAMYAQHSGRFHQSHMWCAIASRQALNLGLHRETPGSGKSWVEAEGDRRLFYATYILERQISNGSPESVYCPAGRIRLQLPCEGFNYRMGLQTETPEGIMEDDESDVPSWLYKNVGPMGFYARLVGARFMVKKCLHCLLEDPLNPKIAPWESTSPFAKCFKKLMSIKDSFPPRLRLTPELILNRHDSPGLGPLVMIYLWWNMCILELSRGFFQGYPESLSDGLLAQAPIGWVERTRQTCLRHAQTITSILSMVHDHMPRQPLTILDHTFPRLVYSSIRVQIEWCEMQPVDNAIRENLCQSFDMMLEFVGRTSSYFTPARLLFNETKRLLVKHSLTNRSEEYTDSQTETPPHPWFRRQKRVDDARQVINTQSQSFLDEIFSTLLDDSIFMAPTNWLGTDISGAWPDPQGHANFGLPSLDAFGGEPSTQVWADGSTSGSTLNLSTATERWRGKQAEAMQPEHDPFLPGPLDSAEFAQIELPLPVLDNWLAPETSR